MKYEEFKEVVINALEAAMPKGCVLETDSVLKNNGCRMDALCFRREGVEAAPTLYVQNFYRAFQEGVPIEAVVGKILEVGLASYDAVKLSPEYWLNWDNVKEMVCLKLINKEKNEELLGQVIYREFLDLAVTPIVVDIHDDGAMSSLRVCREFLDEWGVDEDELFAAAEVNSKKVLPPRLFGLLGNEKDGLPETTINLWEEKGIRLSRCEDACVFVLTNKPKSYGAYYMTDIAILSEIADYLDDDLIVIPSSVNEVMVAALSGVDKDKMDSLIETVNRCDVERTDCLSDHSYLFLREIGRVVM